jgi:hypothetical protein
MFIAIPPRKLFCWWSAKLTVNTSQLSGKHLHRLWYWFYCKHWNLRCAPLWSVNPKKCAVPVSRAQHHTAQLFAKKNTNRHVTVAAKPPRCWTLCLFRRKQVFGLVRRIRSATWIPISITFRRPTISWSSATWKTSWARHVVHTVFSASCWYYPTIAWNLHSPKAPPQFWLMNFCGCTNTDEPTLGRILPIVNNAHWVERGSKSHQKLQTFNSKLKIRRIPIAN